MMEVNCNIKIIRYLEWKIRLNTDNSGVLSLDVCHCCVVNKFQRIVVSFSHS
jgi:hypothetical protein